MNGLNTCSLHNNETLEPKHLRLQNKTKLGHQFNFGQPKQNKIVILRILFEQK